MDLISKPEGYTNNHSAYANPIPILPPPKTLNDKQDTTLLQMALKAFLKQRLYGNFHNFDKSNKHNKNHIPAKQSHIIATSRTAKEQLNSKKSSKFYYQLGQNKNYTDFLSYPELSNPSSLQKISKRQKEDKLNPEYFQERKIRFSLDSKKQQQNTKQNYLKIKLKEKKPNQSNIQFKQETQRQFLYKNKLQEQAQSSFISAIDQSHIKLNYYKSQQKNQHQYCIKLPQIKKSIIENKRYTKSSRSEIYKNPKISYRKQAEYQLKISQIFWSLISKSKTQKARKLKQMKSQNNQSLVFKQKNIFLSQFININENNCISGLNNNKVHLNRENTSKISNYSIYSNENIKKSSNPQDFNTYDKQLFKKYAKNQILTIPLFLNTVMNFFQFHQKTDQKMKKDQIQQLFFDISKKAERFWCVSVFRFIDCNTDGKIDSSDLFKIYNYLENLKVKIQQVMISLLKLDKLNYLQNLTSSNTKKQLLTPSKRQISQASQISKSQKKQLNKSKRRQKSIVSKVQTKESDTFQGQLTSQQKKLVQKNFDILCKLQNQIQKLCRVIIQKDSYFNLDNRLLSNQDGQQDKHQTNNENSQPVLYLQQALLNKKQLKFSDLNLVLRDFTNQNENQKKKVVEIDRKKLNIKLSSCYVQTFSATQHNQQTRVNREYIQTLKDYLKDKPKNHSEHVNKLEEKTLPFLSYSQFYQHNFYISFKQLFFQLIHSSIHHQ